MYWLLFHHNQIKLSQIPKVMLLPDLLSRKWVFLQMTFIWLYKTQLYQLKYLCKAKWMERHVPLCNLLSYQFEGESSCFCIKESQNVLDAIHHMAEVQIWGGLCCERTVMNSGDNVLRRNWAGSVPHFHCQLNWTETHKRHLCQWVWFFSSNFSVLSKFSSLLS